MTLGEKRSLLNSTADQCKLARSAFEIGVKGELHLKPSPDASYPSIHCALTRLRAVKGSFSKMGFVGNETYDPETK